MISINPGDQFGNLIVVREDGLFVQPSGQHQRAFICRCACGTEKRIRLSHLRHKRVHSCGCLATLDGFHGESKTPLYKKWVGIIYRCSPNHSEAYLYHNKGISVCEEWKNSFTVFARWAKENGYKDGLTIDRINGGLGYAPGNCRFVTQKINNSNRCVTYFVIYKCEKIPFALLIDKKNLKEHENTIRSRIKRGWSVNKAIDTPIRKGNYFRAKVSDLGGWLID